MVSLIVCARGLAVILSRIGYSLVKPLLQFLPLRAREKKRSVLHMRYFNHGCQYVDILGWCPTSVVLS